MAFDPESEKKQLIASAEKVLSTAKKLGATACEVGSSSSKGLAVSVRMGDVETIEFNKDQGIGVTVYFGQRKGSASTTDTSEQAIEATVKAARDIAKYTSEDNCAGLADPALMARNKIELDLYYPWSISTPKAIELAKNCEQAAQNISDKIVNSEGASVNTHTGCSLYANSHGFIGSRLSTRHSLSCCVIAKENDDMQRDYWYDVSRNANRLQDEQIIGKKSAERALKRLGARKLSTMKTPVIFSAEIASSLIGQFLAAVAGGNLYRKSSFLINHLGKTVFPNWVQIDERPHLPCALSSSAYDNDGLQTTNKHFIENGVLTNYLLGTYSARKLEMKSTANAGGAHNIFMKPNAGPLSSLLKIMNKGVLLTELFGHGTNLVTGDYSHGAAGFWVENGKIQYPVSEITVAGNLKDMFMNLQMVGNDIDQRRSIQTGSLFIENLAIAGQ